MASQGGGANKWLGVVPIAVMVVCWVLLTEFAQGLETGGFSKPTFITYVIRSSFSTMLIPSWFLRWRRTGIVAPWKLAPRPSSSVVSTKQLWLTCCGLYIIGFVSGLFWYYSLPRTNAAANSAVYQSAPAACLLISLYFLGELLTLQKVVAVALTVAGVCMVSFAPVATSSATSSSSSSPDDEPVPSVLGYLLVVASVVLYALVEVLYARYTEQHIKSIKDLCSGTFVSAHAERERAEVAREREEEEKDTGEEEGEQAALVGEHAGMKPTSPTSNSSGAVVLALNTDEDQAKDSSARKRDHNSAGFSLGVDAALLSDGLSSSPRSTSTTGNSSGPGPLYLAETSAFMLGTIGLLVLLTLWPVLIVFDRTGLEPFAWPDGAHLAKLATAASLDTVFNVSMLLAISLTDPLFTAVGTVLVVPGTLIADLFFKSSGGAGSIDAVTGVGMAVIIVGFGLLQVPGRLFRRALRACGRRFCCCCCPGQGKSRASPSHRMALNPEAEA